MKREYGPDRSAEMGNLLRTGLESLQEKYEIIGEVRGRGLMQGVELVTDLSIKEPAPKHTNALLETTRQVGLLIGKGGLYRNSLRIAPAFTAKEEHIEEALEKLDYAFGQVMELSF
ncbi:aminotransferase class III-fold pyridoxal phosphate-dependent enzyme [Chloroflexota bacterium]